MVNIFVAVGAEQDASFHLLERALDSVAVECIGDAQAAIADGREVMPGKAMRLVFAADEAPQE